MEYHDCNQQNSSSSYEAINKDASSGKMIQHVFSTPSMSQNDQISSCIMATGVQSDSVVPGTEFREARTDSLKTSMKKETVKSKLENSKKNKDAGKSYITSKGYVKEAKKFKYITCKCKFSTACKAKSISESERRKVFESFWNTSSWVCQEHFLANSVIEVPVKDRRAGKPTCRSRSFQYFLNKKRVCSNVFLQTLDITRSRVRYCMLRKVKNGSSMSLPDERGKKSFSKFENTSVNLDIKKFLDKLPKYGSQYSKKKKYYFDPDLSKTSLYKMYCNDESISIKSKKTYFMRQLKKYNVSFYIKTKDNAAAATAAT